MSWCRGRLGEFVTLKRGYDLPESRRLDGDVPVVSSSGITGSHNAAKVAGPGVVTGRYGTLGEVFFVERDFWPLNTALYVRDFHGNDPRFVAYFLQHLLGNTQSDKAAVPGVNRNDLHERETSIPDETEQKAIVRVLSAYDDLIENNARRIKLLEDAARLLYEEWFVRLRFPGYEHVRIRDGVPEGWERTHLSRLVDSQYGYTETATTEPVGPRFLRGTDINKSSFIDWSSVPFCPIDDGRLAKYRLRRDDIVVIRMADPGKVAIVERDIDAVFASYLVRLARKDERTSAYYLFYALAGHEYQSFIRGVAGGSTRKTASAELLKDFLVLVPTLRLQREFEAVVRPMRRMLNVLVQHSAKLREARDLLLPRLMFGEIAV